MPPPFPWQQEHWQTILARAKADRLPHALLLSGKQGLGKRLFAEAVAGALLCHNVDDITDKPCGHCRNCRLFLAGHHPDFYRLEPEDDKKPIRVDQVRAMGEFVSRTSQTGRYKIILLHPAERMNINAANSLLKTLEEPAGASLLLLVTAAAAKLPATIRSRCQQLPFVAPDPVTGQQWLTSQLSAESDTALLLRLTNGAPLRALEYVESGRLERRRQLFEDYSRMLAGTLTPAALTEIWLAHDDLETSLSWLVGWHTDMLRLKLSNAPERLINFDFHKVLRQHVEPLKPQHLFDLYDAVLKLYNLRHTQANMQLQIENFFYISCRSL